MILEEEFSQHPGCICTDPKANGDVMEQLMDVIAASPSYMDSNNESWDDHRRSKWLEVRHPATILYKPKSNVRVLIGTKVFEELHRL